jgi:hypothetical protein
MCDIIIQKIVTYTKINRILTNIAYYDCKPEVLGKLNCCDKTWKDVSEYGGRS